MKMGVDIPSIRSSKNQECDDARCIDAVMDIIWRCMNLLSVYGKRIKSSIPIRSREFRSNKNSGFTTIGCG